MMEGRTIVSCIIDTGQPALMLNVHDATNRAAADPNETGGFEPGMIAG